MISNPPLQILNWYRRFGRKLPWRESRDPYQLWISEIILQQTRVNQGMPYFTRFMSTFPDLSTLAVAEEETVLKTWEGLGYYSRARNLHSTAKHLQFNCNGRWPETSGELIQLKGIGPYTARAIASAAFGEQCGVLDGNVFRVLSRYYADPTPIDGAAGRKHYQKIIDNWMSIAGTSEMNQAVMDFGAMICTFHSPGCSNCALAASCRAFAEDRVGEFPRKAAKKKRKERRFDFFLIRDNEGRIVIRRRPSKGIWGGLFEIPNGEVRGRKPLSGLYPGARYAGTFRHSFTHFEMYLRIYFVDAKDYSLADGEQFIFPAEIAIFAFSKAVLKIFERFGIAPLTNK